MKTDCRPSMSLASPSTVLVLDLVIGTGGDFSFPRRFFRADASTAMVYKESLEAELRRSSTPEALLETTAYECRQ